jgi:hypothetical protein
MITGSPCTSWRQRADHVLLQNPFSNLPTWCMLVTDAYRQHIWKEEGKGAILRELLGDTLPDCAKGNGSTTLRKNKRMIIRKIGVHFSRLLQYVFAQKNGFIRFLTYNYTKNPDTLFTIITIRFWSKRLDLLPYSIHHLIDSFIIEH